MNLLSSEPGLALLASAKDWPDGVDSIALAIFLCIVVLLPAIGYWFMIIDVRAYLRALRGALVVVRNRLRGVPKWAKQETPGCLRSLGLEIPCSEADIKQAYRKLAEDMHPDRGGDRHKFMLLRRHFEESLAFIRDDEA